MQMFRPKRHETPDILWRKCHDKKLRIKLIAASMASLFLVLFVIGGIVGILNYKNIVDDADRILEILEENAGAFPKMFPGEKKIFLLACHRRFPMSPDIFLFCLMRRGILF